jgi:aryl-alcohol dehydrogenase-like predicted oxidoreductase
VSVLSLGAMLFGSVTDEKTSFAVLDRYVEAGGTFIDTSDNYAFWIDGSQGGQSYVREDKPLPYDYDHPGTPARLAALREVAQETGASVNQVVLAWQLGGSPAIIPLAGASSVAQLEENLAAVDLELSADQRARLDAAH